MGVPQLNYDTAMQMFLDKTTVVYQNSQKLSDTVSERHGTRGDATNVPLSGMVEMNDVSLAPTDHPVTGITPVNVLVAPSNFSVKTVVSGSEETLYNYDTVANQAMLHGKAAARLLDYIKIKSIFEYANFSKIKVVPLKTGSNDGINQGKLSNALGWLEDAGVEVENYAVSMWLPALIKQSMMDDERVVNIFYNDVKPLTQNKITAYLNVDVRVLGSKGKNAIPSTAPSAGVKEYLVPLVSKDAIMQIYNREVKTSITYLPNNDRWELLTTVTTGAQIIQSDGIVLMTARYPFKV